MEGDQFGKKMGVDVEAAGKADGGLIYEVTEYAKGINIYDPKCEEVNFKVYSYRRRDVYALGIKIETDYYSKKNVSNNIFIMINTYSESDWKSAYSGVPYSYFDEWKQSYPNIILCDYVTWRKAFPKANIKEFVECYDLYKNHPDGNCTDSVTYYSYYKEWQSLNLGDGEVRM